MSSWEEKLSTPDSSSDLYALPENEEETGTNEEENSQAEEDYFRPIKKLRMMPSSESGPKALTSFLIEDILKHPKSERAIVRPWDSPSRRPSTEESRSESDSSTSPLAALFQMTSKAFQEKAAEDPALNLFSHRQPSKKKRKSRTAFTNHQIFELEKRFLYQKYLSPADRDEIAQSLGLSNAQVITWFQNRRAKLKRDMEELKKDVDAATVSIRDTFPEMKFHSSANSPRL